MIVKRRRISTTCEANFAVTAADESRQERLKMNVGSCYFPKENKLNPYSLGEDAHFICPERQAFGVADGVGGWANKGIDAGIFARGLMSNSCSILQRDCSDDVDLKKVVLKAHSQTVAIGSSTACVLALKGDILHFANVGDSGFMLFRGKRLLFTSSTQQKYFNCPFSLGNWVSGEHSDGVFEGELVGVEQGDIVVAGTDGLFDNLYGSEIEEVLQEIEGRFWPEDLAWEIATAAQLNSTSEEYDSPFAHAAELAGIEFVGGKRDDITVIVAEIELDEHH